MSDKVYIAPAKRESAQSKTTREHGGKHGFADITHHSDGSVAVNIHPRTFKLVVQ